jgi:tetratricopeptide (TPR) repeat protein
MMPARSPGLRVLGLVLLAGLAAACAPTGGGAPPSAVSDVYAAKPAPLRPLFARLDAEGGHNAVLNQMEIGLAALAIGDLADAREAFDAALASIELIYADSDSARKARSLWTEEGAKDFKGEPYERAMAYYYRGLLYLAEDDFDNAAASFKGGLLQDSLAETDGFRADFALLMFLEGWSHQCRGTAPKAAQLFAEVQTLRPDFVAPAVGDRVVLVFETGRAPRKVSDGIGHSELKFRRGRGFGEFRVRVTLGGSVVELYPIEDIYFQSATRGGRPIDSIQQGKAVFRENAEAVGTVLSEASRSAMLVSPLFNGAGGAVGQVGLGLGVVGAASLVIAANTATQADTRTWRSLPDAVHVATLDRLGSTAAPAVTYLDDRDQVLGGAEINSRVAVLGKACTLVWGRSRAAPAP